MFLPCRFNFYKRGRGYTDQMFTERRGSGSVSDVINNIIHYDCCSAVMVGGALLQLFCIANWTGPPLTPIEPITDKNWQQICLEDLSIAGEVW